MYEDGINIFLLLGYGRDLLVGDPAASELDNDDEDIAEAEKVWSLGKLMGFLVNEDRELTKALIRIKKRKNK